MQRTRHPNNEDFADTVVSEKIVRQLIRRRSGVEWGGVEWSRNLWVVVVHCAIDCAGRFRIAMMTMCWAIPDCDVFPRFVRVREPRAYAATTGR